MRLLAIVIALGACRIHFDELETTGDGATGTEGVAATKCLDLPATCGPAGDQPCCEAIDVPAANFLRNYDVAADLMYASSAYPAMVSAFRLDRYEVTVGRYRRFVELGNPYSSTTMADGDGAHASLPTSGWNTSWNNLLPGNLAQLEGDLACNPQATWTPARGANESLPINCVSWFDAMAFCIWDGGYLPTEAEWNVAASGGAAQRAYPWSVPAMTTGIDCAHGNYMACSVGTDRVGLTSPGGDGAYGHADLGGNVWEWTLDYYAATPPNPCSDCAYLTTSGNRTVRGGSFVSTPEDLRVAHRFMYGSGSNNDNVGFRCAFRSN